ncbi:MAG: hypothetical protein ACYC6Y_23635 [Thermoguttaceae bacterium]
MLLKQIWRDQRGFVVSTDLILIATIVILGTLVGLATFRDQVVQEFGDLAMAISRLNQSYTYTGCNYDDPLGTDTWAEVAGSTYVDLPDYGEDAQVAGQPPAGISVSTGGMPEGTSPSPTP